MKDKIYLVEYRFVSDGTIFRELKTAASVPDLFHKYAHHKNMVEFSITDITNMPIEEVGERINAM